jgi:hypothetical protein
VFRDVSWRSNKAFQDSGHQFVRLHFDSNACDVRMLSVAQAQQQEVKKKQLEIHVKRDEGMSPWHVGDSKEIRHCHKKVRPYIWQGNKFT